MDTTTTIAVAGLTTALLGTLTVPLLQAYYTNKREAASRMDERRHATYVDAITYAQLIEARVDDLTEDPLYRSHRPLPEPPDELLIRAKLVLVAPADVTRAFAELIRSWDILSWNVNEAGPIEMDGKVPIFGADKDGQDVQRLVSALQDFKASIRPQALGTLA